MGISMSTEPACRLRLVLASKAPTAVILRRGPSKWFHVLRWDLRDDFLEPGSWFHGRIYEDTCTVSSDGRWMFYLAANFTLSTSQQLGSTAWFALCHPPWLKAVWMEAASATYVARPRVVIADDADFDSAVEVTGMPAGVRLGVGIPSTEPLVADTDSSARDWKGRILFTRGGMIYHRTGRREEVVTDLSSLRPPAERLPQHESLTNDD